MQKKTFLEMFCFDTDPSSLKPVLLKTKESEYFEV